jgi:hypothetical protein
MGHLGMLLHIGMILGGLALMVGAFWGSSQLRPPFDGLAALAAPIGLLLSITGVILLAIPTFFT